MEKEEKHVEIFLHEKLQIKFENDDGSESQASFKDSAF